MGSLILDYGTTLDSRSSQGNGTRLSRVTLMHPFLIPGSYCFWTISLVDLDEQRVDWSVQFMVRQHFDQVFVTDAKGKEVVAIMQQVKADRALIYMDQRRHVVSG